MLALKSSILVMISHLIILLIIWVRDLNELNNDLLKKHLKKAVNPILIIGSGFLNQLDL